MCKPEAAGTLNALAAAMTSETLATAVVPTTPGITSWLQRIQAEYREMPCLNLTKAQMQRLWGLEGYVCDALVAALVEARVLRRLTTGSYVAVTFGR